MLQLERTVDPRNNLPSVKTSIAYKGERGIVKLRQVHFPSKQKLEWAKQFDRFNDSIVELSYDRHAGEWRYIRQREDKEMPNFSSTVIDTLESIAESMDREELVLFTEKHSRPPPKSAEAFVTANIANERACTVRNDLYDADNKAYLLSTPVSLIAPPCIQVPRGMGRGRGRGRSRHDHPQHPRENSANHVGNSGPPGGAPDGVSRQQPDYSDDV